MCQVACLRAGALHDGGVVGQYGVEVIDQGLHFQREMAIEPLHFACAQLLQGLLQGFEWC